MECRVLDDEEQSEAAAVAAFVRKEVQDWDDDTKSRTRFKALSGQRSDWEPLYCFWRDLIIKVARHLHIFFIYPSRVKRLWFRRAGLSPLCLDRVLVEMHRSGDLLSPHTTSATTSLSRFFRRALNFLGASNEDDDALFGDCFIIASLLEEQALEVVKTLSQNNWTNSCVITMRKFEDICLGQKQALAILGYLSSHGKARRFSIDGGDPMEGVKVCLASGEVSSVSSIDRTVLHLIWTTEKLEQQLYLIDKRYQKSRNFALASLKSGNRRNALRYVKELKLTSQSREKCTALLDRVEKVLHAIMDAESSKKVFEAIQSSKHALQEYQISVDEFELCLQEVDENIDTLKQLDNALESTAAFGDIDDEDIENEFNKLQLEIECETNQVPMNTGLETPAGAAEVYSKTDVLSDAMSNLNLKDSQATDSVKPVANRSEASLEAA